MTAHASELPSGFTVRQLAKMMKVKPHKVLRWIHSGELAAINTGTLLGRSRFIIFPDDLAAFRQKRRAAPTPTKQGSNHRRARRRGGKDRYPL